MTSIPYRHDPADPLWSEADIAAKKNDFAALLLTWELLGRKGEYSVFGQIGEIYERGATGVPGDSKKAMDSYRIGITKLDDPICHIGLGRLFYTGNGVNQDFSVALSHFEAADAQNSSLARLYLGRMYYAGLGVRRDAKRAREYLESILNDDYVSAYILLSRIARENGDVYKWIYLRIKGLTLGIRIGRKNPADFRLL